MAETKEELQFLQGIDTVVYFRKLSKAATENGKLLPYQTTAKFDPSKKVDTTATKDGMVPTSASVETDFEVEFIDSTSSIADMFYDSLFNNEKLEVWIIKRKRVKDGKYFAWYFRATVSEDENDNDADDNSTRDVSFSVEGIPQRGWTALPEDAKDQINYIFKGVSKDDGTNNGQGESFKTETAATQQSSTTSK